MTISITKPKGRLPILLLALIALWCASLAIALLAGRQTTRATTACRSNIEMTKSLAPEINMLASYDTVLSEIADNTSSAASPSLRLLLTEKKFPSLPDSLVEETSTLASSKLHMTTAMAKWNSIKEEELSTLITVAESAPIPFRLGKITLAPSSRNDALQVEASFISFSK